MALLLDNVTVASRAGLSRAEPRGGNYGVRFYIGQDDGRLATGGLDKQLRIFDVARLDAAPVVLSHADQVRVSRVHRLVRPQVLVCCAVGWLCLRI